MTLPDRPPVGKLKRAYLLRAEARQSWSKGGKQCDEPSRPTCYSRRDGGLYNDNSRKRDACATTAPTTASEFGCGFFATLWLLNVAPLEHRVVPAEPRNVILVGKDHLLEQSKQCLGNV